ncbi:hypothetical protein CAL29_04275 [Bordetella genomosp. 10]|uniref:Ribosomal protein S3AE n=2 Tax=Bordetella genomosp. 10 TaxID=1416804 RepID=A0A261SLI9_9BORD|nr:hypothetical protein CAL29_04275 [Bordetella genomosp. 10]
MDMMTIPIRQECPPGACDCRREILLQDPAADRRVLMLNKQEEKRLIERIEAVQTLADLRHMEKKLFQLLGITLRIDPGPYEVRTVRGFIIKVDEQVGLCRQLRSSIPAAVRRCLERNPEISYALLNERGLFNGL